MKEADKKKFSVSVLTALLSLLVLAVLLWVVFNLPPRVPTYERDGVPETSAPSPATGQ